MALHTERAQVGPGIAYAFARTPYAHAAGIRGAWRHAPGRVFLGLGSGAYKINRDWFGVAADRPVARMADLVGAVRAWLQAENGQRVRYDGEFYHVDAVVGAPVLGRIDAPILLGAFNKLMAAAAGRTADGIIGHGLFTRTWWEDVVRPAVAKGAAQAEHEGVPAEHGWVITAIDDDDPERAVMDARRMIAFYLTVKTYDPYVEHHGWTAQTAAIREAFAARDTRRDGPGGHRRHARGDRRVRHHRRRPGRAGPPRRLAAPRRRLPRPAVLHGQRAPRPALRAGQPRAA